MLEHKPVGLCYEVLAIQAVEEHRYWCPVDLSVIPGYLSDSFVTTGKSLNLSKPSFPYL